MKQAERIFNPFKRILVPVLADMPVSAALACARSLGGNVILLGLVGVSPETSLSTGTTPARQLRKRIQEEMRPNRRPGGYRRVRVSYDPWKDLQEYITQDPPDLLVLEWPSFFEALGLPAAEALSSARCDVALVRGPWPTENRLERILVPVRGGPTAELALRMGLSLPHKALTAVHISKPDLSASDEPFRGLERILPSLHEVVYKREVAADPAQTILDQSGQNDLLVLGSMAKGAGGKISLGTTAEKALAQAACPVVVVKARKPFPVAFTGPEAERAGAEAISLLVDKWFAENTYHVAEFDDLQRLMALKRSQRLTISLALPALNEEETVGQVIQTIKGALMEDCPLLDEIVLIDSDSTDRTREIAAGLDVPVYIHQQLLSEYGARVGKGEALWKSLFVTHGDLVVWIDTDIVNIHPRFVYGVIGPMLLDPRIQFVKGFYQRPLRTGEMLQAGGGGRVTELVARPLLNLFYPELSGVIQPLAGEYGGRRKALEQLPFFSGYGVETGLLVDAFEKFGLRAIAQVDLLERIHHNQPLEALSKMSFAILQAVLRKLESRMGRPILEEVNKSLKLIHFEEGNYFLQVQEVVERERPPMLEIPEYLQQHKRAS